MTHIDDDTDELRSVAVGSVSGLFENATFPATTDEVLQEFGETEIRYPRGSDSLRVILETSGHETYESRDELELAILNGVRRDAVGRPRYSDRSDEVPQELDRTQQSF
ncbi:DUF5789 family protein [Halopiger goleimassiliensis]|uniref:DUF5789 family protein n=1 Tax=Halopiger goleimassiliensis TaxID=1293048 RepID=UPI0006780C05|nr:DUF5789 family protein [Halopiger goleimassiliensis]